MSGLSNNVSAAHSCGGSNNQAINSDPYQNSSNFQLPSYRTSALWVVANAGLTVVSLPKMFGVMN